MTKQTNPLKIFVQSLTDEERHSIISSYEEFEEQGFTGDTPVRVYAMKYMQEVKIDSQFITKVMSYIANGCYKYYYDVVYKEIK